MKSPRNVLIFLNSYKFLHKWYYIPAHIAHLLPNFSSTCFLGCSSEGTMAHIWWTCLVIHTNVHQNLYKALLNKPVPDIFHSEHESLFHILQSRKKPTLSFEAFKNRHMDIMTNKLVDSHPKFLQIWEPWISYSQPKDSTSLSYRYCWLIASSDFLTLLPFQFSLSFLFFSSAFMLCRLYSLLHLHSLKPLDWPFSCGPMLPTKLDSLIWLLCCLSPYIFILLSLYSGL